MTLQEANDLLDKAPQDDKPSRINKGITRAQAVKIVRNGLGPRTMVNGHLIGIYELRVLQVSQDRKRPV